MQAPFYIQTALKYASLRSDKSLDSAKIILNPPLGMNKAEASVLASQIDSYRNIVRKFPVLANNMNCVLPLRISSEQSSSYLTAKYKANLLSSKKLVDLTAGFGVDLYYFAKNMKDVIGIEQDELLFEINKHNFGKLEVENVSFYHTSAQNFIQNNILQNLAIYIDPARRKDGNSKFLLQDLSPNILEILPKLLNNKNEILIKLSPIIDISYLRSVISHPIKVFAVETDNELKEILVLINDSIQDFSSTAVIISEDIVLQIDANNSPFEQSAYSNFDQYLLLPSASINKLSMWSNMVELGYKKLAPSTHIFTSDSVINPHIGRHFLILEEIKLSQSYVTENLKGKAEIIAKNYPLSADEIRKKYKIRSGGDYYIIAFRSLQNKPTTVVAKRV